MELFAFPTEHSAILGLELGRAVFFIVGLRQVLGVSVTEVKFMCLSRGRRFEMEDVRPAEVVSPPSAVVACGGSTTKRTTKPAIDPR